MENNIYTIIDLLAKSSIIAAGIYGAIQLLQIKKQRARDSALQMLNSVQTPEFIEAMNIIYDLPKGLSKQEIEDYLGDKLTIVLIMFIKLESLGLLVFKREIKLSIVADFMRGPILLYWHSMKNYFLEKRAMNNDENFGEWIQWIAEQIEKSELKKMTKPAYIKHKNWKA
jgi:hypothetical protein